MRAIAMHVVSIRFENDLRERISAAVFVYTSKIFRVISRQRTSSNRTVRFVRALERRKLGWFASVQSRVVTEYNVCLCHKVHSWPPCCRPQVTLDRPPPAPRECLFVYFCSISRLQVSYISFRKYCSLLPRSFFFFRLKLDSRLQSQCLKTVFFFWSSVGSAAWCEKSEEWQVFGCVNECAGKVSLARVDSYKRFRLTATVQISLISRWIEYNTKEGKAVRRRVAFRKFQTLLFVGFCFTSGELFKPSHNASQRLARYNRHADICIYV